MEFILFFFPIVIIGAFLLGRINENTAYAFIFVSSLYFYSTFEESNVKLILILIVASFGIGRAMELCDSKRLRYCLMWLGVGLNIGALGFYKYYSFIAKEFDLFESTEPEYLVIDLPLAISFLAFQQISYLVDVGIRRLPVHGFLRYGMVVSFFPHLIAGPILRYSEISPQLDRKVKWYKHSVNLSVGVSLIAVGFAKKVLLADHFAVYVEPAFSAADAGLALTFMEAWTAALSYTFQIYFDFSAYSDMAAGLAFCLGIRFPVNFLSPYKASSIISFWRRWHVSLSRFLRDYLYVPIGGGRRGQMRKFGNIFITMLIGGIWHGAGWNFLIWGAGHGLALIGNHAYRGACKKLSWVPAAPRWLGWIITFTTITILWVVFRANDMTSATLILKGMAGLNGIVLPDTYSHYLGSIVNFLPWVQFEQVRPGVLTYYHGALQVAEIFAALGFVMFLPNTFEIFRGVNPFLIEPRARLLGRKNKVIRWKPSLLIFGLVLIAYFYTLFFAAEPAEFLYFQF